MTRPAGGWSSPGIIIQILSLLTGFVMTVAGSWMMTQRDDSREVRHALSQHSTDIAVNRTEIMVLKERIRELERRDGGR